jgi:uncharacterized membrane protein
MEFETAVDVDAPAEVVWDVLTHVVLWPEWTESVTSVDILEGGDLHEGSKAKLKQPGFPLMTWKVTELEPLKRFTWESRKGGVTTVADHVMSPRTDGGVHVTHSIHMRGPMAGVAGLFSGKRTRRYVEMEAAGLKSRCEAVG